MVTKVEERLGRTGKTFGPEGPAARRGASASPAVTASISSWMATSSAESWTPPISARPTPCSRWAPARGPSPRSSARRAGRVWAVEQDPRFLTHLREYFRDADNLTLRQADVLDLDLAAELPGTDPLKMVSNLPYNVATAVMLKALHELPRLETMVVLVQRELAERYMAGPGSRSYGIPSLKLGYYCRISRVMHVRPTVFLPPPRVESTLLRLERHEGVSGREREQEKLFHLIDAAFSQRRKTLVNALTPHFEAEGGKAHLEELVAGLGWEPTVRPEELALEDYAALLTALR